MQSFTNAKVFGCLYFVLRLPREAKFGPLNLERSLFTVFGQRHPQSIDLSWVWEPPHRWVMTHYLLWKRFPRTSGVRQRYSLFNWWRRFPISVQFKWHKRKSWWSVFEQRWKLNWWNSFWRVSRWWSHKWCCSSKHWQSSWKAHIRMTCLWQKDYPSNKSLSNSCTTSTG